MRVRASYILDVDDHADAAELADALADILTDGGITVVSSEVATVDNPYTVGGGIKGKPSDAWVEHVTAPDREAAVEVAVAADSKRTVNLILDGHQEVEPWRD